MTRNPSAVAALVALLTLPLAGGCSSDPNSSGAGLLPDSLVIESLTPTATSDSVIFERVRGNQTTLLVGKTADYEARSLIRFSFPAFDTTVRIDSGVLELRLTYRLPAAGGTSAFEIHNMTATWSSLTFLWDSVAGSFDPDAAGSFSGTVASSDTIVRIPIDTALIRSWFLAASGSFMLIPTSGSSTVIGFGSHLAFADSIQPVLEITLTDTATQTIRRSATSGVFVAEGTIPTVAGTAVLQSGIAYRSRVMFDSLSLPKGAAVAQAWLELVADPAIGPASRDTLTMSFIQDRAYPLDSIVLSGLCYPVTENGIKLYRGDVKSYVQLWNTREPNAGIIVKPLGELTTLDRIGIFNASSPDSSRPRIRITYSRFP